MIIRGAKSIGGDLVLGFGGKFPGFGDMAKKSCFNPGVLDLFQLSIFSFSEEIATKQQAASHLIS